jgi:hypothetical protein
MGVNSGGISATRVRSLGHYIDVWSTNAKAQSNVQQFDRFGKKKTDDK